MRIEVHYPDVKTAVLSVDRWPPDVERKALGMGIALRRRLTLPADFDPVPYPALRISVPATDPPLLLLLAPRKELAEAVESALAALPTIPPAPETPGYL